MSRPRRAIAASLPIVFGLSEPEAAAAIGISASKFRALVQAGRMPTPRRLDGRRLYDVDELRTHFKALPHEDAAADDEVDTWADLEAGEA